MRRGYLTNFHGSAGTALVLSNPITIDSTKGSESGGAYLWTDSRYFNEATLSLDSDHWTLMKQNEGNVPTITKFLVDAAIDHYTKYDGIPLKVGLDPYVHSSNFAKELIDAFTDAAKDVTLVIDNNDHDELSTAVAVNGNNDQSAPPVIAILETLDGKTNIVDSIWDGRPALPKNPFVVHPMKYAGMSVIDKVTKIRTEMKEKKATLVVFGALDDIAYLFNVRCMNDVETCPVGIAYATISHDVVTLYCDEEKVTPTDVGMHLLSSNVIVRPYEDVVDDVRTHVHSNPMKSKVWFDGSRSNYALSRVIPIPNRIDAQNPIAIMKSVKNDAEMEGMRRAHIVDGAAMAEFMAWLEHAIVIEGRTDVSEVEVDLVLTGYRAKQPGFKEVSFPTIAGCGSNGAIVHYRAAEGSDLLQYVSKKDPILIDSGGQYEYGTTDVTRTWFFGDTPSDDFKEAYTRVLKGNIGVDTMIFPENTPGFVLDVFARKALWEVGLDYGHGTGHGVGAALNVHEGPHSISPRWLNKEVLKRGMVTSNEPGYYEDGNFGVRIENLLEIIDVTNPTTTTTNGDDAETTHPPVAKKQRKEGSKKFLKFACLTQIPIQKNLIKLDIMTNTELDWLDAYHEEVLKKVAPLLEEGSPSMKWLVKSCEKIERH
jgi:Xaa-Pro aminopeptidase